MVGKVHLSSPSQAVGASTKTIVSRLIAQSRLVNRRRCLGSVPFANLGESDTGNPSWFNLFRSNEANFLNHLYTLPFTTAQRSA